MYTGFWWGNLRERAHLEDLNRWEDNIKMYPQDVSWGEKDWIFLAQNGSMWCANVDVVMNFRVP